MSNSTITINDFEGDGTLYEYVRDTEHGPFKAIVMLDDDPTAPDGDMLCPVVQLGHVGDNRLSYETTLGGDSERSDGLPMHLGDALNRVMVNHDYHDAILIVQRWLQAFHGGDLLHYSTGHYREYDYIAYDTRAMRDYWGQADDTPSKPEMSEWIAYVEGDVFYIEVQRGVVDEDDDGHIDWVDVPETTCHGFYGEEYAAEEAVRSMEIEIEGEPERAAEELERTTRLAQLRRQLTEERVYDAIRAYEPDEANWPTSDMVELIIDAV